MAWVQAQVHAMRFKDATHAFEFGIVRLMEEDAEAAAGIPQRASPDDGLLDARKGHASSSEGKGASKTESTKRQ
jgi:hypothetical protein